MHGLGTHMKVDYADAGGANAQVILDEPYTFDDQKFHPLVSPLVTRTGGHMTVACSYVNPTGMTVPFGERTEDEMCYALTFVYPPPPADTCTR